MIVKYSGTVRRDFSVIVALNKIKLWHVYASIANAMFQPVQVLIDVIRIIAFLYTILTISYLIYGNKFGIALFVVAL